MEQTPKQSRWPPSRSRTSDPQELQEIAIAALTLCSLKTQKLDRVTASSLQDMTTEILSHSKNTKNPPLTQMPLRPNLAVDWTPPAIPPVPSLASVIGECSVPFEKQLTRSDVRADQNRLALNKSTVEAFIFPLLKTEERRSIRGVDGIHVTTYDWRGKEHPMRFKIWVAKTPVLISGWKKFYEELELKAREDFVCVWVFRHLRTEELCFVITSRRQMQG